MPKRRPKGTGSVYQPHGQAVWWISYRVGPRGARKRVQESAETTVKTQAETFLRSRLAAADAGALGDPAALRLTLDDLERLVAEDYKQNDRRSGREVTRAYARLRDHFGGQAPARGLSAAAVATYKTARLEAGAAKATVNRELGQLRRGLRLAVRLGHLSVPPSFSLLREGRPRQGFLEPDQFEAIARQLAPDLRPLVTFLYWTGWRVGEARALEWRQVDRKAGVIRIEVTKNDEPRTIPYVALPALKDVIEGQHKLTEALSRKFGRVIPRVFHRRGEPILYFFNAWRGACKRAGLPGRLVHDMRRSAARNMIRAGISQRVAMAIGGWKTDSVFRRYAIVDEKLIAEGLAKLAGVQSRP